MCRVGAAPEAPWRCPEDCPFYVRKLSGGGWVHGSLENTPAPEPPPLDEDAISVLQQAQGIVNSAGPGAIADAEAEKAARERDKAAGKRRKWWPFGK